MRFSADQVMVFVDVETTGLDANHHEIIEIAAVRGTAYDPNWTTFTALVKPRRHLPRIITEITGLYDSDLENADPIESVFPEFMDFVGHQTVRTYNAPFDKSFLVAAGKQTGRTFVNKTECILKLTRSSFPRLGSYKLENICELLEIQMARKHRALDDAVAAMKVFFKCHGGNLRTT